jgi:hypothetical protein
MACSRQTRRCGRLPSPSGARWRTQQAHRPQSVRHPRRRPPMPARRRAISGPCCSPGCSSRCRWSVPTAARTCASSPSSPRPRPSSRCLPISVSRRVHPRSRPLADRPPGTRHPSQCRTGTSLSSPSPTSSSISASPGSRRLSQGTAQPLSSAGVTLPRRCMRQHPRTRVPAPPRRPSAPQLGVDPAPHPR